MRHHTHPILQNGRKIKNMNYQISDGYSRLKSQSEVVSSSEFAPLCRDEQQYTIFSCIRGRLLEVNEAILNNPDLLLEEPSTEGYIAV